jgi:hypothetical protein
LLATAFPAAAVETEDAGVAISAKPGKGVTFEDEGSFKLQLRGRFQVQEAIAEQDGDVETDSLVRRARLAVEGYLFDEAIEYELQLGFAGRDLDSNGSAVLDAYVNLAYLRDLNLKVGQFKIPFERSNLISSSSLQFVDRSRIVGELSEDRDRGIALHSDDLFGMDGLLGYNLGIFSGEGRGRVPAPGGFLYVARVDVRPFGAFDDYKEGDLARSEKPRLALGGAVSYNQNAIRKGGTRGSVFQALALFDDFEGFDYLGLTADAVFKWNGLSLFGEFAWRDAQGDDVFRADLEGVTTTVRPENTWGWFIQAGQMIGPNWEVVARYDEQHALAGSDEGFVEDLLGAGRSAGAGVNWYVHGHSLKVQADYFRVWGGEAENLPSLAFEDGANEVRIQLQAAF